MPAKIDNRTTGPEVTFDQFKSLSTSQYDGVVYVDCDNTAFIGVYTSNGPRLMQIDTDGGTILLDGASADVFPLYRAPEGYTVTFSN